MDPISLLKYLLSNQYEPEEESPQKFFQSYQLLASHRDDLQEKYEAKAKRRAEIEASKAPTPAPEVSGSRFSILSNTEEDLRPPRPKKHQLAVRLTEDQVKKLSTEERKALVTGLKDDIQFLENEKKERKAAGRVGSEDDRAGEEVAEDSDQDG